MFVLHTQALYPIVNFFTSIRYMENCFFYSCALLNDLYNFWGLMTIPVPDPVPQGTKSRNMNCVSLPWHGPLVLPGLPTRGQGWYSGHPGTGSWNRPTILGRANTIQRFCGARIFGAGLKVRLRLQLRWKDKILNNTYSLPSNQHWLRAN